jgi:hypothetical protein
MGDEVMTVSKARQLMPDTTATMSDTEVEKLIGNLEFLATSFVQAVQFNDELIVNIAYNRGNKVE